ncbi:MAG TPA: glycosyltransferase [Candidatus Eisenbacteria bacterium]|nr:glycosyltransferase [Candidatus Eisenbacteria bacterium]
MTIAIPTYNRAATFLPLALKSALAQTYDRIEVLVADNASTDTTEQLVRGWSDPRLTYHRHARNVGPEENYNYCLNHASGDYFLLLHDDDLIDVDFVAACIEAAHYASTAALVRTGIRIIDEHGRVLRHARNEVRDDGSLADFFRAWFSGKTRWYLANTLFNTRRLKQTGGFHSPYRLAQDGFAIARLAPFGRAEVAEIKASFRLHRNEQTFARPVAPVQWGLEWLRLLDFMCELVPAEEAPLLRREGARFFAKLTYHRAASTLHSPWQRLMAYYEIFQLFRAHCLPCPDLPALRSITRAVRCALRG